MMRSVKCVFVGDSGAGSLGKLILTVTQNLICTTQLLMMECLQLSCLYRCTVIIVIMDEQLDIITEKSYSCIFLELCCCLFSSKSADKVRGAIKKKICFF